MHWNREIAGIFIALLMLVTFILLLIKRRKLEKGSSYFIGAIGISTAIEMYCAIQDLTKINFDSAILYIIAVNFIFFLLVFIYFQNILETKKLKKINLMIIIIFLFIYGISIILDDHFFLQFPFFSYFVEVILLAGSIYLVMSQTFNSDRILSLGNYFPFWVCISLLIIYLGVLPLLVISHTATSLMNLNIFYILLFIVNAVGYGILLRGVQKANAD